MHGCMSNDLTMRPQHDNDTSCTETKLPGRDQPAVVGKITEVNSETSYLLSNRLNLCSPALTQQRSLDSPSLICPTGIIYDLASTRNDDIGCSKGNGDGGQPHRSHSSLDFLRHRLNQNEQVIRAGALPQGYQNEVVSLFEPIRRDLATTSNALPRNNSAEWTEEGGNFNRCCWMSDVSFQGDVDASEGVPSSTSSPVSSIVALLSAISSSISSPDISQDLISQILSTTGSTCDIISQAEHKNETQSDFDVGMNSSEIKTGFVGTSEIGNWSTSLCSGTPGSPESYQEPAVNRFAMPSPAPLSWCQMPCSGAGRITWLCNYGCHKPVRWKCRLCETEHRRQETGRLKEEKALVARNDKTDLNLGNTNDMGASGVVASLPMLTPIADVVYSKHCLIPEVFEWRFISRSDKDINSNFDRKTGSDRKSAIYVMRHNTPDSVPTTSAPVCSCSDGVCGMREASYKDFASANSSSSSTSRDENKVTKSEARRDYRRREARSIDDVSVCLQSRVSKLREQRCYLAEVIGRYHEERQLQHRQLSRLQKMSGSARKKELMVNILRELRLMIASQIVSLQRSYDQILSRQWKEIFQCIFWS